MQIFDPLDPMILLLYGLIITVIFLAYVSRIRRPSEIKPTFDDVGTMVGNRVEEITTGAVQESMPAHLVSVEEEREEHEGEDLWS